jgi:hypothetical protein
MLNKLRQVRKDFTTGGRTGDEIQAAMAKQSGDYGYTILPIGSRGREFYKQLDEKGINTSTPVKLAGALGARLLTDAGTDSTRGLYWRYNNPIQIADRAAQSLLGPKFKEYSPTKKAAIGLATVGVPVTASLGTYDITNIGELGRPKGYAQTYAEEGSEDRRQTSQAAPELIDRFVLGRQGRPLKFETAKEDIPDLTKQRYSNYMNYLYNEKGPLGVGIIKGTTENLQGEPELRIVGFPVGLQAAGAVAGGAGAAGTLLRQADKRPRARTVAGVGAGGAVAGALAGKFLNRAIAAAGQSDLPSTYEYDSMMY